MFYIDYILKIATQSNKFWQSGVLNILDSILVVFIKLRDLAKIFNKNLRKTVA